MGRAALWIHGHTHTFFDYDVARNARGVQPARLRGRAHRVPARFHGGDLSRQHPPGPGRVAHRSPENIHFPRVLLRIAPGFNRDLGGSEETKLRLSFTQDARSSSDSKPGGAT